ncbi:MAG TPA: hypothetical protein VF518_02740, partial [Polyangia bacterium]
PGLTSVYFSLLLVQSKGAVMTRRLGAVAALAVFSWTGFACSGADGTGSQPGGVGGNGQGGGSIGSTGGSTGGGGQGGSSSAGGNGAGGAETGGTHGAGTGGNAGTGGGLGGGGTDGGSASPVVPTSVSGTGKYRFESGDLVFEVDAQTGARVATLSLAGTDMVISSGTDNTTWGSVFWPAPRSSWTPKTWPPPAAIDSDPYTGGPSGNHLVLTGATDSSMGISMGKDYSVDGASGWITIVYTINATKAVKAAPWEDTRVPRGGIAFFPAGTSLTTGPLTTMTTVSGINWFDDAAKSASSPNGSKAYGDGTGGWAGYAVDGVLFLKRFTDQPASALAPSEGEVDIYPGAGFLEFEVLGPYTSIAAGGNLPWTIQWKVVKIPSSVTVSVGSTTLVDFATQQAAL